MTNGAETSANLNGIQGGKTLAENTAPRDFDSPRDLMKGLSVRNTFLDFSEDDPWTIGPNSIVRQKTDSILDRNSSLRAAELEQKLSSPTSNNPFQYLQDPLSWKIPQMPMGDFPSVPMTNPPYERSEEDLEEREEDEEEDEEEGRGDGEGNQDVSDPDEQKESRVSPEIEAMRKIAAEGGGLSGCTTVMMRHVPFKYTQRKLLREINSSGFMGQYDYMYLPMDPRSHANRGFAFINLISAEAAEEFYKKFHGQYLRHFSAETAITVLPADLQGFAENALRYAELTSAYRGKRTGHTKPIFFRPLPPHIAAKVNEDRAAESTPGQKNSAPNPRRHPERPMYSHKDTQEMASAMLQQVIMPAMRRANGQNSFPISEDAPQVQPQTTLSMAYGKEAPAPTSAKRQGANFCVYCGKKRLTEHLFCPYCGHQFQS